MALQPSSTADASHNAFGARIPSIAQIASDPNVGPVIQDALTSALSHLGVNESKQHVVSRILEAARWSDRDPSYERVIHTLLVETGIVDQVPRALSGRAELIAKQIGPYVKPGEVVDVGCGDGKVGHFFNRSGTNVTLCDVYEHPNIAHTGLRFHELKQIGSLPFLADSFDCALVLTVFHHCDEPLSLLRDVARVLKPGGRLIVIESVFGVNGDQAGIEATPENHAFLQLSGEQQRLSNIFFDHFYNRIVHYSDDPAKKVNIPFNFNTPAEWDRAFTSFGLHPVALRHLGIDQPVVPEYHTLHVHDKRAP